MDTNPTPALIWARRMAREIVRSVSAEHGVNTDHTPAATIREACDALINAQPEFLTLGQHIAGFFTDHGGNPVP